MVLSNAERQARFQKRMRERLSQGVTPEMVDQVARVVWERARRDDPSIGDWDTVLSGVGTKKGLANWSSFMGGLGWAVPDEAEAAEEYGDDGPLVRRVLLVLQAAQRPPSARQA